MKLSDECRFLKGVGPARARLLDRLGIRTLDDLVTHYPRKYYDRRHLSSIADLRPSQEASVMGQILSVAKRDVRARRSLVTAAVGDDTGILQVVWFNQDYIIKQLKPGSTIVMSGELSYYRGTRQMVNPEFEVVGDELGEELLHAGRIVPVYRLTSGVSQRFMRRLIASTLEKSAGAFFENLPGSLTEAEGLPSRYDAVREIHFPSGRESYLRALRRMKLEELFFMQLVFRLHKRGPVLGKHVSFRIPFVLEKRYLEELPFELTAAQRRVLEEIHRDLCAEKPMRRLLQGDVGSGKTVIAGAALLAAVEAGTQAAFMVPTEILAMQHFRALKERYAGLGVDCELLIGSLKSQAKKKLHDAIAKGSVQVVIGTHALIQEGVDFSKLALVVIDEQHRFGVRQRAALLGKEVTPHLLVMTATPIPRTLALTAYADLDLSLLDEMPPGRAAVKTRIVTPEKREKMLEFIHRELLKGARGYFLYPIIEETEKLDLQAATSAHRELSQGVFEDVGVGLLHGKMSFEEKERAMADFASGRTGVLVSTTVVEVGVHVPEATIMVVNHPERFGLSQLHQLRGRIGRGGKEGYCFLLLDEHAPSYARERLDLLTKISDGFKISEEDLRLRGPGEFFGVRQHGMPGFKLANPIFDRRLVEKASSSARKLLDEDPELRSPENRGCRLYLERFLDLEPGLASAG